MRSVLPLVVAAGLAVTGIWDPLRRRALGFAGAFALGTWAAIALPGRAYPHYFQLWLPLFSVMAAWSFVALQKAVAPRGSLIANAGPASLILVLFLGQAPNYFLAPDEWSRRKSGSLYVASRNRALAINGLLAPGETFYEWGAETGLYFYSRRRPPTGVFYNLPLLRGPLSSTLSARVLRDLAANRPELVVIPVGSPLPLHQPVLAWIGTTYSPIPSSAARTGTLLMVRIGGALESRLYGPAASSPDHAGAARTH
jgi:hypothetical protein